MIFIYYNMLKNKLYFVNVILIENNVRKKTEEYNMIITNMQQLDII